MAESDDAQVQRTGLLGLVRGHVTLVLTLIPILLSGLRIFAVANGDRPTLVTLLSTLDVKAVLLGTFAWLLPTAFGVAAAICWIRWLQLRSASPPLGAGQTTALLWLALCTTLVALILFALAPVNQPVMVGYVLMADPRYATVLKAADSTVQILELDDVESRTICRLNPELESASLVRYVAGSASKRTPPC